MRTETKCRLDTKPGDIWRLTHYPYQPWYMTLGDSNGCNRREYMELDGEGRPADGIVYQMNGPQRVEVRTPDRRSGERRSGLPRRGPQPGAYPRLDRRSSRGRRVTYERRQS